MITLTAVSNPNEDQAASTTLVAASYKTATLDDVNQIGASSEGRLPAITLANLGSNQPSIALSPSFANAVGVTMAITLTPQVPIPSGGRLIITLVGTYTGSTVATSSPTGCSSASWSGNVLTLGFSATIPSGALVITVTGVSNPTADQAASTTLAAASYTTSTLTSVNQIGASSAGVLPAINLANLGSSQPSIVLSTPGPFRNAVGVTMAITLTPQVPIPSGGRLIITLVGGFAGTSLACSSSPTACTSASLASNVLTLGFSATIPSGALVITVTGVSNPTADQQSTTLAAASYNTATFTAGNQVGASSTGVLPAISLANLGSNQPSITLSSPGPFRNAVGVTMVITLTPPVPIPAATVPHLRQMC